MNNDTLRVSILGSVEVTRSGETLRLSGSGQRAVLAALAHQHGLVVPTGRLIEALWDSAHPRTARTKVQSLVSALRVALGYDIRDADSPLQTIRPGYVLRTDKVLVDATEFGRLLALAREADEPAAATVLLGDALALWRGPAVDGLRSASLRSVAGVLDGQRLLAIEAKADADMALGRHATVIAELAGWVDAYPLRERLRELLMQALHLHGCRANALHLYRAGQLVMRRELGLEPSARLQSVYRAVLADDRLASTAAIRG